VKSSSVDAFVADHRLVGDAPYNPRTDPVSAPREAIGGEVVEGALDGDARDAELRGESREMSGCYMFMLSMPIPLSAKS
jgi:hypothetical protein